MPDFLKKGAQISIMSPFISVCQETRKNQVNLNRTCYNLAGSICFWVVSFRKLVNL